MKRIVFILLVLGCFLSGGLYAQVSRTSDGAGASPTVDGQPVFTLMPGGNHPGASLNTLSAPSLPLMSPELAMASFQRRSAIQAVELASYSAVTLIHAELPDTSQQGEFELQRTYSAPRTLLFRPIHFVGDKFVKANIIARLLQSEVDHVERDDASQTALTPANYHFSYKGRADIDGHVAHLFQVKPRKKRPGLFKGRIYLEARSGSLLRAEGVVKSPSFFVKHIEFVQDYADIDSFTLPVHIHSEARARIVGRTIIDITHSNYQPVPAEMQAILPTM